MFLKLSRLTHWIHFQANIIGLFHSESSDHLETFANGRCEYCDNEVYFSMIPFTVGDKSLYLTGAGGLLDSGSLPEFLSAFAFAFVEVSSAYLITFGSHAAGCSIG